jgi:sec-independent protein translocase protein TatA
MPGWLGPWEIIIVVVIILLIFGGRLIPRLGSSLGRSIVGLKKGIKEGEEEFKTAIKQEELGELNGATMNAASQPAGEEAKADRQKTQQS